MYAFDFDGTFVSCRERHTQLMAEIIGADFFVKADSFWRYKRKGMNNVDALASVGFGSIASYSYSQQWMEKIEDAEFLSLDKRIVDDELLGKLSEEGDIVIVTARASAGNVEQQVSKLGLSDLITDLIVVPPSGSARGKEQVLGRLRPSLFVGDTESDFEAALLSDIPFRAVSSGMRSREFLLTKLAGAQIYNDVNTIIRGLLNEVA